MVAPDEQAMIYDDWVCHLLFITRRNAAAMLDSVLQIKHHTEIFRGYTKSLPQRSMWIHARTTPERARRRKCAECKRGLQDCQDKLSP